MKPVLRYLLLGFSLILSLSVLAEDRHGDAVAERKNADPVRYTKGLRLYQQNCAVCHGRQGEGAANWRQRDAQGKFLPPPLNGAGHTWHHPLHVLKDIIRNGTGRFGGNMPAWEERLSEQQIDDILYWIQSQWSNEIYQRWRENDRAVREDMQHNR